MRVNVYTKKACVQCDATKRALDKVDVPYSEIDLEENPDIAEKVKSWNFHQAPVVEVIDEQGIARWSGFRPDLVKELAF